MERIQEQGYASAFTRKNPAEIFVTQNSFGNALSKRDGDSVGHAGEAGHATPVTSAVLRLVGQRACPECERVGIIIDQCEEVLTRSTMVHRDLSGLGIPCTHIHGFVQEGNRQIMQVQMQRKAGDAAGTRAALAEFRINLQSLRDAFRGILIREDLPPATAHDVLSAAQSLEVITARMGTA